MSWLTLSAGAILESEDIMKRQIKYYVSELKPSCIGTVWHRLSKYYLTETEALAKRNNLSPHYDSLSVRVLYPNNTRKTLS